MAYRDFLPGATDGGTWYRYNAPTPAPAPQAEPVKAPVETLPMQVAPGYKRGGRRFRGDTPGFYQGDQVTLANGFPSPYPGGLDPATAQQGSGGGDLLHGILGTAGSLLGNLIPIPILGPAIGKFAGHALGDLVGGKTGDLDNDLVGDFTDPLPFGAGKMISGQLVGQQDKSGPGDKLEAGLGGLSPFGSVFGSDLGGGSGWTFADGGRVKSFETGSPGRYRRPAIKGRTYNEFSGIWDNPRVIAEDAARYTAPEDPAMKTLFGVNRNELYERFKDRVGNVPGMSLIANQYGPRSRGSDVAQQVMIPSNAQRLQDILAESERRAPEMTRGMQAWYAMEPAYDLMAAQRGVPAANVGYRRFNTFGGMASPQSTVSNEISRGIAANTLANQGRFGDFEKWPNIARDTSGYPEDMQGVPGSMAHKVAAKMMSKFIDTDKIVQGNPKIPLYIGGSGVPATGFQTDMPVPDSHFSRGVGIADVRHASPENAFGPMSSAEFGDFGPWFRDEVASPLGIQSLPGQARLWGVLSNRTGVKTAVGAPKLELLSKYLMDRSHELGVDPYDFRDKALWGEGFAGGGRVDPFGYLPVKNALKSSPVPRSMEHLYKQFTRPRLA